MTDIERESRDIAAMTNDEFWSHYVDVIEFEENETIFALYETEAKRRRKPVY